MKNHRSKTAALSWFTGIAASAVTVYAVKKFFAARRSDRNFDLRGKVTLITGGSRGFGFALAQEFGNHGSRLALCARDDRELEAACRRLAEKGIEAAPFICDITKETEIPSLLTRVVERFGSIDILVNNAGFIKVGPLDSFEHADFEAAMNLMFWAPVNLTFAVLPLMKKQGEGRIVNITSIGGRVSVPHLLPYSCAKFALVGFSSGISTELRPQRIHVLTVVPGLMRTGSYLNAEFTGESKDEFAWFGLLGNLPGFSVAAAYAAGCVRKALQNQQNNCTISLPAKLLIAAEALVPETTRNLLQLVNRTLLSGSRKKNSRTGKVLNQAFGKLFQALTALGKNAALKYNE